MSSASKSKFVFLGVSTGSSAVNLLFPRWCEVLGVDWTLEGVDLPIGSDPGQYRNFGFNARRPDNRCIDNFTQGSCLRRREQPSRPSRAFVRGVRRSGSIASRWKEFWWGGVSDVASGGEILKSLFSSEQWLSGQREVLIIGGGGAGLAAAWNIAVNGIGSARRILIVEHSLERSSKIQDLVANWPTKCRVDVLSGSGSGDLDVVTSFSDGSLIINASGVGKDQPGSPVSDSVVFPLASTFWEFNYRGDLPLMHRAYLQERFPRTKVEDGKRYFATGWSVVMSKVAGRAWSPSIAESFELVAFDDSQESGVMAALLVERNGSWPTLLRTSTCSSR